MSAARGEQHALRARARKSGGQCHGRRAAFSLRVSGFVADELSLTRLEEIADELRDELAAKAAAHPLSLEVDLSSAHVRAWSE